MTQNTKQKMLFKAISHKKVIADFNGGNVTSDAGLLFLREIEKKTGIIDRIASVLHDPRHPGYVKHDLHTLLRQRAYQIIAGYEDANDSDQLRHDPVFKIVCDQMDTPLASQPTISRFENTFSRKDLYRIAEAFIDTFIVSYKKTPQAIILDLDDTPDFTYGHQQLSFFNAYHGGHCFMPLHIYEGTSGKLITTILRTGKRPSGKEIVMILKRIVRRIRQAWPNVGILIRADSHYGSPEVFDFCESNNLKFVLGLIGQAPMLRKVEALAVKAREFYLESGQPVKLFTEFRYQAGSWNSPQRVICKVEYNDQGSNIRFIITNLNAAKIRMIYDTIYCARGAMELMIKEHKNGLCSDRTSCNSFLANQFRLFLHSIAYVLMHAFREKCLKNTQFARAQFDTIRLYILKIGARVIQLSTKIKIHLPSSNPYKDELMTIWQACITNT
ncbi:IS1380 family transposase [bacterium]|nr:MAG: IS1380 family transposase [bacterium]